MSVKKLTQFGIRGKLIDQSAFTLKNGSQVFHKTDQPIFVGHNRTEFLIGQHLGYNYAQPFTRTTMDLL